MLELFLHVDHVLSSRRRSTNSKSSASAEPQQHSSTGIPLWELVSVPVSLEVSTADRQPALGDPALKAWSTTGTGHTNCSLDIQGYLTRTTPLWGIWHQRTLIKTPRKQTSSNISKWYPLLTIFIYQCLNNIDQYALFQCCGYCFNIAEDRFMCLLLFKFSSLLVFQLSERARERKVPVTRIGRLVNFGGRCVYWYWSCYKRKVTLILQQSSDQKR